MSRRVMFAAMSCLVAAGCQADEPEPYGCTLIGCSSGAQFGVGEFPASDIPRLTGSTIEVCLNSECNSRVLDELPPQNDLIEDLRIGQGVNPWMTLSIGRTDPSGEIEIAVAVRSHEHDRFEDGDVYRIRIVASDASTIVDRSWSATYATSQPNGPDCEPTCRQATNITEL